MKTTTQGIQYEKLLEVEVNSQRKENILGLIEKLGPYVQDLGYNENTGLIYEGKAGGMVVSGLIKALADHSVENRKNAAGALGEIRPVALPAVPHLISALNDLDKDVRYAARWALILITLDEMAVLEDLIKALQHQNHVIRIGAADVITAVAISINSAAPLKAAWDPLMQALQDENSEMRQQSAAALYQISVLKAAPKEDISKVPYLAQALKDAEPEVRQYMARTLSHVCGASAIPVLVEARKDKVATVRACVVQAFANIGKPAAYLLPAFTEYLKEEKDKDVKKNIVLACGKIDNTGITVPALITALQDKETRSSAVEALGWIGKQANLAIPALINLLADKDLTKTVDNALSKIGGQAIKPFVEAIKSRDAEIQQLKERAREPIGLTPPDLAKHESQAMASTSVSTEGVSLASTTTAVMNISAITTNQEVIVELKLQGMQGKGVVILNKS